jgi:hypothetical protein
MRVRDKKLFRGATPLRVGIFKRTGRARVPQFL